MSLINLHHRQQLFAENFKLTKYLQWRAKPAAREREKGLHNATVCEANDLPTHFGSKSGTSDAVWLTIQSSRTPICIVRPNTAPSSTAAPLAGRSLRLSLFLPCRV